MLPIIRITKKRSRDDEFNEEKTNENQENVDNNNSAIPKKDKECNEVSKAANILTSLNSTLSSSQSLDSNNLPDMEMNNNSNKSNILTVKYQPTSDVIDYHGEEKDCDDRSNKYDEVHCVQSNNSHNHSDSSDSEDNMAKKKRRVEMNDNHRYQSPCAVFAKMHYDIADDDLDEYCKVHNLSLDGNKTRKIIRVLIHKERLAKQQRQFMQMNNPKATNHSHSPSIISEILNLFVRNADIIMEEYGMFPRTGNFQSQLLQCIALQEAGCSNRVNQPQPFHYQQQAPVTTLPQSPMASPITSFQGYYSGVSPVNATFSPRSYPPPYLLQSMRRSSPVLSQAMLPPPMFSSKQMTQ